LIFIIYINQLCWLIIIITIIFCNGAPIHRADRRKVPVHGLGRAPAVITDQEGSATAKGDKGGKYNNKCAGKKNGPKRDKEFNIRGERYGRKASWKRTDEAQIRKGRSSAPKDIREIADAELKVMNENKGRGPMFRIAPIVLVIIWRYYCSIVSHTLRSVQGWSEEALSEKLGVKIPHYSTLCKYSKRFCTIISPAAASLKGRPLTVAVDSTGIGSRTAGLWRHFIWGSTRGWLKLHAMIDVDTGIVIAYTITSDKKGDSPQLLRLADAAKENGFVIRKVLADGAYDTYRNWNGMDDRKIVFIANIRNNAKTTSKCPSRTEHVKYIQEHGKEVWYEVTGYTMRWKAETSFSSLKKLFGESLRAKSEGRLNNELDCRIEAYNSYKVMCYV